MRTDTPQPVRLSDYRPFPFLIETTALEFQLEPAATRVRATLAIKRSGAAGEALFLNGERLKLISAAIDGQALSANEYSLDGKA
jgi:aminopeptidase N